MNIIPTARDRFELHRPRITLIASYLTLGVEVQATDAEIADLTGIDKDAVAATRNLMVSIGALEHQAGSHRGVSGRWKLLKMEVVDSEI